MATSLNKMMLQKILLVVYFVAVINCLETCDEEYADVVGFVKIGSYSKIPYKYNESQIIFLLLFQREQLDVAILMARLTMSLRFLKPSGYMQDQSVRATEWRLLRWKLSTKQIASLPCAKRILRSLKNTPTSAALHRLEN